MSSTTTSSWRSAVVQSLFESSWRRGQFEVSLRVTLVIAGTYRLPFSSVEVVTQVVELTSFNVVTVVTPPAASGHQQAKVGPSGTLLCSWHCAAVVVVRVVAMDRGQLSSERSLAGAGASSAKHM